MKNTGIAIAFIAALIGTPAVAADIATKAPPPAPAPAYSWTGFYLNAGGGYGIWNASDTAFDTTLVFACPTATACPTQILGGEGYLGTMGGGFDYQLGGLNLGNWNPQVVVGVLGDYDFEGLKGSIQDNGIDLGGLIKETSAWAAGGRIGLAWRPGTLSYVNGGVTGTRFGGASMVAPNGVPFGSTLAFTTTGWFFGAGTETTLSPLLPPGWFLRSEYRYSSYAARNVTEPFVGLTGTNIIKFEPSVQTLTTSLVYKFDWTGAETPTASAATPPIAYKAPHTAAPNSSWSGFYLDAGGGYGMWSADESMIAAPPGGICAVAGTPACTTWPNGGQGYLGTVGGGFDYQFGGLSVGSWNPQIVAGLLADWDFSNLKGNIQDLSLGGFDDTKETSTWAAGARIGLVWTPQMLSYVNGGATGTRFSAGTNPSFTGYSTPSFTTNGWFFGGGTEFALSPVLPPGWFLRSEYRYSYFDTADVRDTTIFAFPPPPSLSAVITFRPTVQTFTTALVYKFNWH